MKLLCHPWFPRSRRKGRRNGSSKELSQREGNAPSRNAKTLQDKQIEVRNLDPSSESPSHSSQPGASTTAVNYSAPEGPKIVVSKSSETDLQPQSDAQLASQPSLLAVPGPSVRSSARQDPISTPQDPHDLALRLALSPEPVSSQRVAPYNLFGPTAAQTPTTNVSGRRDVPTASATELQKLLMRYRKNMLAGFSSPSEVSELDRNQDNYITLKNLREIITEIELGNFLSQFKWYDINRLQQIWNDYLCIIAILIDIGWEEWEQFHRLFLKDRMAPTTPKGLRRNDMSLPFAENQLSFLGSFTVQRAFVPSQFKFKHEVLKQDVDYLDELPFETRLPFKSRTPVFRSDMSGTSSSRPIFKVEVDKYGIELEDTPWVDRNNPIVAMKVFAHKPDFDQEVNAQTIIKKHGSNHQHIVTSLTSFLHRGSSSILYPWADCDLNSLCFGKFSEFSLMADGAFRPRPIIEQLQGIAQGVSDLHTKYKLRHYDLKLENLFVFLRKLNETTDLVSSDNNIGTWRIGDFGLAKLRELKSREKQPEPIGVEAERSANSAPRSEGTYQAPEMHDGSEVNSSSDNYSLGCVFAVVYVFMIGGPTKVIQFRDVRKRGYSSDQFFKTSTDGIYSVKKEIFDFLRALATQDGEADTAWKMTIVECIRDLTVINPDNRISAQEAADRLGTMLRQLPDHGQLWKYTASTNSKSQALPSDLPIQQIASSSPRSSLTGRALGQSAISKALRAVVRRGVHNARPARQIPHFPPARCDHQSLFTRLDVSGEVCDVAISPTWIAFVTHDWTEIFSLEQLVKDHRIWKNNPLLNECFADSELIPTSLGIQCFEDSDGVRDQKFQSVHLAGPFVALFRISKTNPDDRVLEIKRLRWSDESLQIRDWSLTYRNVSTDCEGLALSAQGAVAFLYNDRVELLFKANYDGEPAPTGRPMKNARLRFSGTVRAATFSQDGSFLCVWYTAVRQFWHVYKINNEEGTVSEECYAGEDCWRWAHLTPRQQQLHQQRNFGEPHQVLIVPAAECNHEFPCFYALDEDRQIWLITPGGSQMIEPSQKYCVGGPFAAPLPKHGILNLNCTSDLIYISVAAGLPGLDIRDEPYIETMSEWKQCTPASTTDIKGLSRLRLQGHEVFVVAHLDGGLALHFCT